MSAAIKNAGGDLCTLSGDALADEQESLLRELAGHFAPLLESSPDGIYLFLNDRHKVCNENLARLLGVTVEDWSAAVPLQEHFVAAEDRDRYCGFYVDNILTLTRPVTFPFRARRRDGSTFAAETDMIPITFRGYAFGFNFVRPVGE